MSSDERLGHLIRRCRVKINGFGATDIKVPNPDFLRILNAADLGLYLSVQSQEDVAEIRKKLKQSEQDLSEVLVDRTNLRSKYQEDMVRVKALGFKEMDELLTFVEAVKAYRGNETKIYPELPILEPVEAQISTPPDLPF